MGRYDGPVTWVAPGDSDKESDDDEPVKQYEDTLEDPLLGPVARTSREGKLLLAARKQHGASIDMRYTSFDPLLYLATVHQRTPLSQVEQSAERLSAMAAKGGKVTDDSKKLIHANFGRFVAAHDKMLELRATILADDGVQAILDSIMAELSDIEESAKSAFAPILAVQTQSDAVRTALSVLERHHSLFQLPSLIKEDGAALRYDRVVATYARAQSMLGAAPHGVLLRLREEVEAQVECVCRGMRRRLADVQTPVAVLPHLILNLSKLEELASNSPLPHPSARTRKLGGARAGDGKEGGGLFARLVATVRACVKMQEDAVLATMARTLDSFEDQVRQIPGGRGVSVDENSLPEQHSLAQAAQVRAAAAVGACTSPVPKVLSAGESARLDGQARYDALVKEVVSTSSHVLSTSLIRLLHLELESLRMLQRELGGGSLAGGGSGGAHTAYESGLEAYVRSVYSRVIHEASAHLYPLFDITRNPHVAARQVDGKDDCKDRSESGGSEMRGDGRQWLPSDDYFGRPSHHSLPLHHSLQSQWLPSHSVTMECLNVICLERSQVRGEKSKAAERGVCQMREKRAQHAQKCAIGERREQRAEEREGRREERGVGDEKRGEESVSRARI
jgi:hypothetical protein